MLIQPDCIPCILNMSINAIRKLSLDDTAIKALYADILTIPGLNGLDWKITSPEIIEIVMKKITDAVKDPDPFQKEKDDLNKRVLKLYPVLSKLVAKSSDPLYTAAKISILGNSIDFMMPGGTETLENFIIEKLDTAISRDEFTLFSQRLPRIKKIVYFADNCGEIVFDKLFIKTIKDHYNIDVVFVVRSMPTLNDATLKEAEDVGLEQVAEVIDNGIDGPLPGTILKRCSSRVKKNVDQSDLIISKGGGNFDSLEEEVGKLKTSITFMLLSKCHPMNHYFNIDLHQPIMANFFKFQ